MIYFDSDVLVHYFANYDPAKSAEATAYIRQSTVDKTFCVSLLCVQETSFAMAKVFDVIKRKNALIDVNRAVNQLLAINPVGYTINQFHRASQIAQHLGFKNISDCLHTAIAEANNCKELVTYNRKDFARIQPLTSLKITIL